jgi:endoglucanase
MLTLAAMHVLDNKNDPVYTSVEVGAYEKVKPKGIPCDSAFPQGCKPGLSRGKVIAIAVIVTVVGLALFLLLAWYLVTVLRSRSGTGKSEPSVV